MIIVFQFLKCYHRKESLGVFFFSIHLLARKRITDFFYGHSNLMEYSPSKTMIPPLHLVMLIFLICKLPTVILEMRNVFA